MSKIILKFVKQSIGGNLYDKAFECLSHMRTTAANEDEAAIFNNFFTKFNENLQKKFNLTNFSAILTKL